jgi:chaperonin GroES
MKIQPLGERILVKRVESESKKGGIIIPDSAKEKPMEAEVVALGPGKLLKDGKRQPFEVKKGDRVIIEKYSGTEVTLDDEELILIREDGILAVLK